MNYLNIHTDLLRSEEFLGEDPVPRATWLCLMAWCATQENGGRIAGCADWTDRKWQQLCGVTKDEVEANSALFRFDGPDLVVSMYPVEKEAEVRQKREAGRKGGLAKAASASAESTEQQPVTTERKAKTKPASSSAREVLEAEPIAKPECAGQSASTERKGRERNGMEWNGIPPKPPEGDCDVGWAFPIQSKIRTLQPIWAKELTAAEQTALAQNIKSFETYPFDLVREWLASEPDKPPTNRMRFIENGGLSEVGRAEQWKSPAKSISQKHHTPKPCESDNPDEWLNTTSNQN